MLMYKSPLVSHSTDGVGSECGWDHLAEDSPVHEDNETDRLCY